MYCWIFNVLCYVDYFVMFYSNVYNIVYNNVDNTLFYRASAWHILHIDMFFLEPLIQTIVLYCIALLWTLLYIL